MLRNAILHWKTTTQPVLTIGLVVLPMLTTGDGPLVGHRRATWFVTVAIAVGKVLIGGTQKDSGTRDAKLSGASLQASTARNPFARAWQWFIG